MQRLLYLLVLTAAVPGQQKVLAAELTIARRPDHPTVYLDRADIERARANRERYSWAKKAAEALLEEADQWLGRGDDEIISLIPPPGACYAYGFSGCPICGGKLAGWWGQNGAASLDDPGHVACVNGHRLPDEDHPDPGDGYVDDKGQKYYFVGTYNAYVIDTLTTATTKLVHAYALTGDEKYAERAALILDHLARIYPTSETGSWDYPSTPPSGRFNRPWYQVARTLVFYVNQYDILMMGSALNEPSSVPGMTRRENIEQNLLLNGARYCFEQSMIGPALHNGQADYIRGAMAVGAAMGIPQYIAWGVDGPYSIRAMIANNIDRDGQYYETSAGYSDHSRSLYLDIAAILQRYTDEAYPQGIKLWEDPAFLSFYLLPRTRLRVAGLPPSLGDDSPNLRRAPPEEAADARDLSMLERLRALSDEPALAQVVDDMLLAATGGDLEAARAADRASEWLLFHARPIEQQAAAMRTQPLRLPMTASGLADSDLISQKGLALLRSGDGEHARAVTLRAGPTLNHGHLDEMNLNIYARGWEMSYDLGYGLGSTHTQVGWAKQTASHNLVLVDETPQLQSGRSGGSIERFVALPHLRFVRANDPTCYESQGVTQYRRSVALIDASDELSYVLDVFHVEGGGQHDYVFHARGAELDVEGVELGQPRPGSLAGDDVAWGDLQQSDGNMKGIVDKNYWNPPPGNGLGFLMRPRFSPPTSEAFSATWTVDEPTNSRLRLTMLPAQPVEVVTAEAPGIYPHFPKAAYLLARRAGPDLRSTYASIIEPYGPERAITAIRSLAQHPNEIAVEIQLADGRTDLLRCADGLTRVRIDGHGAQELVLIGANRVNHGEVSIELAQASYEGRIDQIDFERNVLYTDVTLPEGDALAGEFVIINNPAYAQTSAYRIAGVTREGGRSAIRLAPTRLTLGRGHLQVAPMDEKTLPNVVPLEYAKSVARKASGFFRGKIVTTPAGRARTRIIDVAGDGMPMTVESSKGFAAGDDLVIYDIQPGDSFILACWARATRGADGQWQCAANAPATLGIGDSLIEIPPGNR